MAGNELVGQHRTGSGWELLHTRNFSLLFSGQLVSQIGDSMSKVALLWFVYELTGSAFKMAEIGLLQTIPPLVFGPLIGVYLDRLKKKPVMICVDLIRTGLVLIIPLQYGLGALTLEWLYMLVFAISIVSSIFGPALASSVPLLVPRAHLTSANAWIQSTTNIGLLIGPAISGVSIAMIGAANVLFLNAATFMVSALCLMPIRTHETLQSGAQTANRATVLQDFMVGFRFVFLQHRTVLLLMLTATLYSLGASAFVFLLPVYATQQLDASPVELGWLWSALGMGMLVASVGLARINQGDFRHRLRLISAALTVGAVAVGTLVVLRTPILAAALIAVFGGSIAMFTPIVWAMLQELTPKPLLGRVFTTFSTGAMAAAMAGMAGFGLAADALGPAMSLMGIGILLLGSAALAALFSHRQPDKTVQELLAA
jgi:DHA3 family macrolide efflux protein-like MFS transporter